MRMNGIRSVTRNPPETAGRMVTSMSVTGPRPSVPNSVRPKNHTTEGRSAVTAHGLNARATVLVLYCAWRNQEKLVGFEPPQHPLANNSPVSATSIECGPADSVWPSTLPVAGSTCRIQGAGFASRLIVDTHSDATPGEPPLIFSANGRPRPVHS